MPRAACVGECMLELVRAEAGRWAMQFGGDTYNAAVYLARGGIDTAYLTALGTDRFSADMRADWAREGIDLSLVATVPDRYPGLYAIDTDDLGERSFTYWRDQSAARALFTAPGITQLLDQAAGADLLYLSGITLSLFDADGQARLQDLARAVRARGGMVAFDSNYRPRGWANAPTATAAIAAFAPLVDIALPTLADEMTLFGDADAAACATRWHTAGATMVVVKQGGEGALLSTGNSATLMPTCANAYPRDTTGAGDSFNGAMLAALLQGAQPAAAVAAGHRLAGEVIRHPGAIIPAAAVSRVAGP